MFSRYKSFDSLENKLSEKKMKLNIRIKTNISNSFKNQNVVSKERPLPLDYPDPWMNDLMAGFLTHILTFKRLPDFSVALCLN